MTDIPMITRKIFLAASVALAALSTHAEPVQVRDFDIFVDPPTAFVFVKLGRQRSDFGGFQEPARAADFNWNLQPLTRGRVAAEASGRAR